LSIIQENQVNSLQIVQSRAATAVCAALSGARFFAVSFKKALLEFDFVVKFHAITS
jgi:hypothetical protein